MSQVTSHVLDTTVGKPAAGMVIILSAFQNEEWRENSRGVTNKDGRVTDLLKPDVSLESGIYRLRFETGQYFKMKSLATFYPYVDIVFDIQAAEHYHVPLLLSPFGYSTYRGS